MRKILRLGIPALVLLLGASPVERQPPRTPKPVVTTRLDKTAVWVGDKLEYGIQVIHERDVEFILESLKKENLNLGPFVVRAVDVEKRDWAQNQRLLEIRLVLSTFESGKSELTIPPFNLFYFRRRPGIEVKETTAESVRVPSARVGLRSTLQSGPLKLRDYKPVAGIEPARALTAAAAGSLGILFVGLRGGRWAWSVLRRERPRRRRPTARDRLKFAHEGMARMRTLPGDSAEDILRFYAEASQFLRGYLSRWLEIEAQALTPEEIEAALRQANVKGALAQRIKAVLESCDAVRFAKEGAALGKGYRTELLETLENIVRSEA